MEGENQLITAVRIGSNKPPSSLFKLSRDIRNIKESCECFLVVCTCSSLPVDACRFLLSRATTCSNFSWSAEGCGSQRLDLKFTAA